MNNKVVIWSILFLGVMGLYILGEGNQVRHYTYGGDLAEGIRICIEDEKSINSLTKKSPLLKLDNLGHISRIIMVGIIINFIIIIGASFFIEAMDLILKSTVLFLMFLFMIGIVSEKTIKRSGL